MCQAYYILYPLSHHDNCVVNLHKRKWRLIGLSDLLKATQLTSDRDGVKPRQEALVFCYLLEMPDYVFTALSSVGLPGHPQI